MKRMRFINLVVAALFIFAATAVLAQPMRGGKGRGWDMGSKFQRMYNTSAVVTVTGTVESVDKVIPIRGMSHGIHLTLKTDKETVEVHLGPDWYIDNLDTKIAKGDSIEIKGSKATLRGKPVVIAAEVKKGDKTIILRDSAGVPAWSARKK